MKDPKNFKYLIIELYIHGIYRARNFSPTFLVLVTSSARFINLSREGYNPPLGLVKEGNIDPQMHKLGQFQQNSRRNIKK